MGIPQHKHRPVAGSSFMVTMDKTSLNIKRLEQLLTVSQSRGFSFYSTANKFQISNHIQRITAKLRIVLSICNNMYRCEPKLEFRYINYELKLRPKIPRMLKPSKAKMKLELHTCIEILVLFFVSVWKKFSNCDFSHDSCLKENTEGHFYQ